MNKHRAKADPRDFVPLQTVRYLVMASLNASPNHGWGVIRDIAQVTRNQVQIGVPTLYENISRLIGEDLIEAATDQSSISTRKTYQLTRLGLEVLREDERIRLMILARNHEGFAGAD